MNELYQYLQSEAGWSLGKYIIMANALHAVWLFVMWMYNRKPFEWFANSGPWAFIAIASWVVIAVSAFVEFAVTSSSGFDGRHPFMAIYFSFMAVLITVTAIASLFSYGADVRKKLKEVEHG